MNVPWEVFSVHFLMDLYLQSLCLDASLLFEVTRHLEEVCVSLLAASLFQISYYFVCCVAIDVCLLFKVWMVHLIK